MNTDTQYDLATPSDASEIALMADELFQEIMDAMGTAAFNSDRGAIEQRLRDSLVAGVHFVMVARVAGRYIGFCAVAPCYAIYTEGAFGIISELYVRASDRSRGVGRGLLDEAKSFADQRGWSRLEVTTPPLPLFQRTLAFYEREGFCVTGGRKLKWASPS